MTAFIRYAIAGGLTEALRWDPDDPAATGFMVAWLQIAGADFHHPSGAGATTTLAVHSAHRDEAVARPGDYIGSLGAGDWAVFPGDEVAAILAEAAAQPTPQPPGPIVLSDWWCSYVHPEAVEIGLKRLIALIHGVRVLPGAEAVAVYSKAYGEQPRGDIAATRAATRRGLLAVLENWAELCPALAAPPISEGFD